MTLTREQLLKDLHQAYLDARRHKRQKAYQQRFERNADENLERLCDELYSRTYRPGVSACFIIRDPKQREVFAAQFRDRIVHHLYYNYVHVMMERTFIADSYSCIPKRGTHYGIDRLDRHIRQESQNYRERCYVMKMDISGYFMHISRSKLLSITLRQLRHMAGHRIAPDSRDTWNDRVDMDFTEYLTRVIALHDPLTNCMRRGRATDWIGLPREKSLFYSPEGCGLPIGNLTSQLFSNIYLNELDQYIKRTLRCRHYGRYVDDFYIVSCDREWLLSLRRPIADFVEKHLGLSLNEGKTIVAEARRGVEFLGAYVKPRRRYVSNHTLRRMKKKIPLLELCETPEMLRSTLNSMLGLLQHYRSYTIRRNLFCGLDYIYAYGHYKSGLRRFVLTSVEEKLNISTNYI